MRSYVHPHIGKKSVVEDKRTGLPAHYYKDNPDDQKRWFTADPLSGILEELGGNSSAKAWDELRFRGATHNLAGELASRLDPAPRRDVFAGNDGSPRAGELVDESLVRDDAAVEVDFY